MLAARTSKTRRAGVYGRESKDYLLAIGHQHRSGIAQAESEGFVVPEGALYRFADNDVTGATANRSDFQRLIRLVTSGQADFERIYIQDRSRFGRFDDVRQALALEYELEQHGVTVRYIDEEPIDWGDPSGKSSGDQIKAVIDTQYGAIERRKIANRGRKGKRHAVIDGSYPGTKPPWGTERWLKSDSDGKWDEPVMSGTGGRRPDTTIGLRWDPEAKAIVRRIYREADAGKAQQAIAEGLNRDEIDGPGETAWSANNVGAILRNPIYKGDLLWGAGESDEAPVPLSAAKVEEYHPIYYPDFAPGAPITPALWQRVRNKLEGQRIAWERRRSTSPDFLLSGLLVCAYCGAGIHGNTRPTRQDGSRLRYYRHDEKVGPKRVHSLLFEDAPDDCAWTNRNMAVEPLETAVISATREIVLEADFLGLVQEAVEDRLGASRSDELAAGISELEEELEVAQDAMDTAADAASVASKEKARQSHRRVVDARAAQIERLESRIEQLRSETDKLQRVASNLPKTDLTAVADSFDDLSFAELKELLGSLIHHAEVRPDTGELFISLHSTGPTNVLPI